ncbi:MAG: hypothetical protein QM813_03190 [Verrucomicrobiota bacterium]
MKKNTLNHDPRAQDGFCAPPVTSSLNLSIEEAMAATIVAVSSPHLAKPGATPILPKANTLSNLKNARRVILLHLPEQFHQIPLLKLEPELFEGIANGIASGIQGRNSKKKYFQDARKMCRELRKRYGMGKAFEKALSTPRSIK